MLVTLSLLYFTASTLHSEIRPQITRHINPKHSILQYIESLIMDHLV